MPVNPAGNEGMRCRRFAANTGWLFKAKVPIRELRGECESAGAGDVSLRNSEPISRWKRMPG
jgi:hypothetical protein